MRVRTLIETKNLDILASVCRFPWPRRGGLSTSGSGSSGGDVAVVMALQRWRGGTSRRCQPSLSISLGFEVENDGGSDEPRTPSCQSPPPLYRAARRGPPASSWAGRPCSGLESRAQTWPLGQA